jgi:hypothetical protein
LSSVGTREALIERYKEDLEYTEKMKSAESPTDRDGYVIVSQMLEQSAKEGGVMSEYFNEIKDKSQQMPKFMDVTITSLGLEPEKHTASGAPSVTADVIKKLAGDPFADPPVYGSVSYPGTCTVSLLHKFSPLTCPVTGFRAFWKGRMRGFVQLECDRLY